MTPKWLIIFILIPILLKVPVSFSFIGGTALYLALGGTFPLSVVLSRLGTGLSSFILLAIPLFIFAGNLLSTSGIAKRIFRFANASVGHIPGGLGHVNVVCSIIFAGMSGVAQADAAGLGKIEMDEMQKAGYEKPFSAAITAASAVIGPIIPPSGVMVMYASLSGVALDKLFLAGFVPGILLGLLLMITIYVLVKSGKITAPLLPRASAKERWIAFVKAAPALAIPAFLIYGLLSGVATPTELGALTCLFATILGLFDPDFHFKDFCDCALQTVKTTGTLGILLMAATPFTWVLGVENLGRILQEVFMNLTQNPYIFILVVNLILICAGMLMETAVIQMVAVPILAPIALVYGFDPIHFAMIVLMNLLIGTITPPFGVLLFTMMDSTGLSLEDITKAILPFYIPMILFLILITLFPWLSTFIPTFFG